MGALPADRLGDALRLLEALTEMHSAFATAHLAPLDDEAAIEQERRDVGDAPAAMARDEKIFLEE